VFIGEILLSRVVVEE